ncbi:MAG: hypothetical protein ACKVW3_06340 [Phycisphaerales bacterium]
MSRPSIEDEVCGNLLRQPIGTHAVADLALPRTFVDRVVDRIIRATFQQRHRIVVASDPARTYAPIPQASPAPDSPLPAFSLSMIDARVRGDELSRRLSLIEGRPERRSFAAFDPAMPPPSPGTEADAAGLVATRLAYDGLATTTIGAIVRLGPNHIAKLDQPAALLRRLGLPIDLLLRFHHHAPDPQAPGEDAFVRTLAAQLAASPGDATAARVADELRLTGTGYRPTQSRFRISLDSGQEHARAVRLQATSGKPWFAEGAGGGLDVVRQVLAVLPELPAIVSVEDRHAADFAQSLEDLVVARRGATKVVVESLPVAQWAQDNARAGAIGDAGQGQPALLVPRFASRGEEGSIFVPGESLLASGLEMAGVRVLRSPLIFQGGNVLAHRDPEGRIVALIGEAEVYRNVALGLTATEALEALRLEFGADDAVMVPAIGFHTDFEVSIRAVESGKLVAFVNDTLAGARLILDRGLDGLVANGSMSARDAAAARDEMKSGRMGPALERIGAVLSRVTIVPGHFPESFAATFRDGEADFAPANFETFLIALDIVAASLGTTNATRPDDHGAAYLRALRRANTDRRSLVQLLKRGRGSGGAGVARVVGVPSLAETDRGINYVNCVHLPGLLLMPAAGGFYSPLDRAAAAIYERELGPGARVVQILCAESQRRNGGVHCAVAVG